jgi:hypothetical protein
MSMFVARASLIEQSRSFTIARGPPEYREKIGRVAQRLCVSEQKHTVTAFKPATGFKQVLRTLSTGGDSQDTEAMKTKTGAMDVLFPRRFVGERFAVKGRLTEILPDNRHGGTVGFKKVKRFVAGRGVLQTKRFIRSQTQPVGTDVDRPMKRVAEFDACYPFIFPNESDVEGMLGERLKRGRRMKVIPLHFITRRAGFTSSWPYLWPDALLSRNPTRLQPRSEAAFPNGISRLVRSKLVFFAGSPRYHWQPHFTAVSFRADTKARRVGNLLKLTEQDAPSS